MYLEVCAIFWNCLDFLSVLFLFRMLTFLSVFSPLVSSSVGGVVGSVVVPWTTMMMVLCVYSECGAVLCCCRQPIVSVDKLKSCSFARSLASSLLVLLLLLLILFHHDAVWFIFCIKTASRVFDCKIQCNLPTQRIVCNSTIDRREIFFKLFIFS